MIRHQKRREYPPAAGVMLWHLWHRYGGAEARTDAEVELDAIRTAGALVVGTGVAVALLLAARRQCSTELTLVHTEHDASPTRPQATSRSTRV